MGCMLHPDLHPECILIISSLSSKLGSSKTKQFTEDSSITNVVIAESKIVVS